MERQQLNSNKFELQVENFVQEHPRHPVPTFRSLTNICESCEQQHKQAMAANTSSGQPSSSKAPTSLPAAEVDPDPPLYYACIPEPNQCLLEWQTYLKERYDERNRQ
ncbi:hypothetical protein PGT21_018668 [Puccinia graminis f. sp. tritici]|uniref:Uncharacterized protein n=1 Tax=Puccinia graminis f. sp. tritici TaxID=56615 RepID=A0A5B0PDP7_PUCGR|nr:hypothetical protein PGTUg99_028734 [Puccinia graminis f. sp. tritici]KAA1099727.1 hypothetical protein PGT21_018668 [Puccinia graminis f. sp. tritici]